MTKRKIPKVTQFFLKSAALCTGSRAQVCIEELIEQYKGSNATFIQCSRGIDGWEDNMSATPMIIVEDESTDLYDQYVGRTTNYTNVTPTQLREIDHTLWINCVWKVQGDVVTSIGKGESVTRKRSLWYRDQNMTLQQTG